LYFLTIQYNRLKQVIEFQLGNQNYVFLSQCQLCRWNRAHSNRNCNSQKSETAHQIAFASIPIIFAVQQFSEGILWLALTHPEYRFLKEEATYTFLFFAQVIWPIWVPWSIMILEKKEERKRIQKIMLTISLTVTIYLLFCLFIFDVDARIGSNHIHYALDYPASIGKFGAMLYIFVTIFQLKKKF
jgi:hypothetical protein